MYYIYSIKNISNNMIYIGQTKNPERRRKRHFSDLRNNKHDNIKLQRAFIKYGENNFIFSVLEKSDCQKEDLDKLEMEYIEKYDSCNNGYNLNRGGIQHNGFESKLSERDIHQILSVIEFSSRSGKVLSDIFKVTTTTISRIKNGLSHLDYKMTYELLDKQTRQNIFNSFCEKTDYIKNKNKSTIYNSKRKFSEDIVHYILSILQFGYREIQNMSRFLNVDSGTIHSIKKGNSYKDFFDSYKELSNDEKKENYNRAIDYFNLNVSSYSDVC